MRTAFFRVEGGKSEDESKGAIAPFAAVVFDSGSAQADSRFIYWSAKETAFVKLVQAVILNRADFTHAKQADYQRDDKLWKIYWWGTHRDESLIRRLRLEQTFEIVLDPHDDNFRIGFLKGKKNQTASGWLLRFNEFPSKTFKRYGPLPIEQFRKPPPKVNRRREKELYHGPRLLIKRGVGSDEISTGRIVARYETSRFCFRHSIYCMNVAQLSAQDAKIILAILWSSLTRYYLFLTSGGWGLWHDEVLKETLRNIPIRFPATKAVGNRIEKIVDDLRQLPNSVESGTLFDENGLTPAKRLARIRHLETALDEAVFDLFDLSNAERDRVKDLCGLGLDLLYRGMESDAVKKLAWPSDVPRFGRSSDLTRTSTNNELGKYLRTYLELWDPQLKDQNGRLRWRVVQPPGESPMMALIFQTENNDDELPAPSTNDEQAWHDALGKVNEFSRQSEGSRRIYVDGMVRVVTDTDIVIIKRNERRLWTPSAARDDAEATMVLALQLGENRGKGSH